MASYLVDLVLLAALLFTSIRVTRMHRELVQLRSSQGDFASILGKTTETVDDMVLMVREFSADGKQLVNVLGGKIEEARARPSWISRLTAMRPAGRRKW